MVSMNCNYIYIDLWRITFNLQILEELKSWELKSNFYITLFHYNHISKIASASKYANVIWPYIVQIQLISGNNRIFSTKIQVNLEHWCEISCVWWLGVIWNAMTPFYYIVL